MRKILLLIMLLNCLFIVGCEQSNTYQDNGDIKNENSDYAKDDLVYSEYSEGFSTFNPYLFYKIDSYEKYMQISRVYRMKKKDFDERYFYEKGLVIFVVSESSGSYRHELQCKARNGTLDVEYKRLENSGGTSEMKYWTVIVTIDKEILNKIETVKINDKELLLDDKYETKMSVVMPEDFSFNIITSDGIMFNSRNGSFQDVLKGTTKTIDLTVEELEEIYAKLREVNADRFNGSMFLNDESSTASPRILLQYNDVSAIFYGTDNPSYEWFSGIKLCNLIREIVANYIYLKIQVD